MFSPGKGLQHLANLNSGCLTFLTEIREVLLASLTLIFSLGFLILMFFSYQINFNLGPNAKEEFFYQSVDTIFETVILPGYLFCEFLRKYLNIVIRPILLGLLLPSSLFWAIIISLTMNIVTAYRTRKASIGIDT